MPKFYEFFAGGGMARAGLGLGWECVFANDFDAMKGATYGANWGDDHLVVGDINKLSQTDLPGQSQLAWASFPCQDLSNAGAQEGIGHWKTAAKTRSGTFWPFIRLMRDLKHSSRAPELITLENVCGTLTSNGGRDFATICSSFSALGYRFGALVIDAVDFVPQSRPRLFLLGVRSDLRIPETLRLPGPGSRYHPDALRGAHALLSGEAQKKWVWWNLPSPRRRLQNFTDLIEDDPVGVAWHTKKETARLISLMSETNRQKVREAQKIGKRIAGGVYKRTRVEDGKKQQRAEIRFDDIAGCLRTPAGGSSRQSILVVNGKNIKSRLLSPREAARLMGLPDSYKLPSKYNDAYHVAGDGVVAPVVSHLARNILEPVLQFQTVPAQRIA